MRRKKEVNDVMVEVGERASCPVVKPGAWDSYGDWGRQGGNSWGEGTGNREMQPPRLCQVLQGGYVEYTTVCTGVCMYVCLYARMVTGMLQIK